MDHQNQLSNMIAPLLAWYEENKRPLPWREEPSPYHVWISEIMLQQTRIEAVIPYYHRFLREIPDIKALSEIPDDKLMKLWEGLGYYSRARNLKKAAIDIMEHYNGSLPDTAERLRKLSGIGDYTAGAIASISFGKPEPAVDGNVLRVVTRYLGLWDDITLQATKRSVSEMLRCVYPSGENAKNLTQAIMELGEALCIPNGEAKCSLCPLKTLCTASKEDLTDRIPVKTPKKTRKIEEKTVFLLSCRGKYALSKRPKTGLLAGLWEYPNTLGKLSEEQAHMYLEALGIHPIRLEPSVDATHIFTHIEWHMTGYTAECLFPSELYEWKTPDEILSQHAVPTAFRAYTKYMTEHA